MEITEEKEVTALILRIAAEIAKARAKTGTFIEKVNVDEAHGRIAANDVFSALNVPPFDRATMDGYAVRAADTFYADENNPASLSITGYISAGKFTSHSIGTGSCVGIATGAPLPKGANAVVRVEDTAEYVDSTNGKKIQMVKIYKPAAPAENIMLTGSDIKRGELIVKSGSMLTPRETGVLAACGLNDILVRKKPLVAVISTGNELVAPGEELEPAKIYDVNARALSDTIREVGCNPRFLGIAHDDVEAISAKLNESLESGADVIVTSGGTSAGVGDLLPKVIEERGEILVHGVDIKPGKPFIFGLIQEKPVFGLPGNPTSALVTFNLFVAPLLQMIAGIPLQTYDGSGRIKRRRIKAKTAMRIFSERGRNEYVLVNLTITNTPQKTVIAHPILTGSGAITTLSKAEGYLFMAKGKEIIEEGETVDVELLTDAFIQ